MPRRSSTWSRPCISEWSFFFSSFFFGIIFPCQTVLNFFQTMISTNISTNIYIYIYIWKFKTQTSDFWTKLVLVEVWLNSFLRGPCVIRFRFLTEGLEEILGRSSLRGTWEVLTSRSCKIRSSSSRSFYDDLVSFPSGSWHEDLGCGLLQTLVRSSWGDPGDMLFGTFARSCTGPCEKFLKRSGKNSVGPLSV